MSDKKFQARLKAANPFLYGAYDDSSDSDFEEKPKKAPAKRKKAIPKAIKTLVWNTQFGSTVAEAKCYCCKSTVIHVTNFHCGHVIAEANGGTLDISNLRPICAPCNSSMGKRNMNEFMKTFGLDDSRAMDLGP